VDLSPYVDQLRRELTVAAELGGDEARALAERLAVPLESAVRLALLSALSAAAEEITGQLAPGAVDVRLRGGDIGFVVTAPPAPDDHLAAPSDEPEPEPPPADADEGNTSRVTLRLPEQLKTRIEDAARREGFSLNAWLVRAVTRALDPGPGSSERRRGRWSGQQYSGWVR
jgi:hypothetical protein